MLFNSVTFGIFLGITFLLHWLPLSRDRKHQNYILLVASYIFYGWWDYRFLSLIFLSSFLDFFLGRAIHREADPGRRKLFLILSLSFNLGVLFVFKYFNFFVSSFLSAFAIENSTEVIHVILPVGISFYTFQTLSYSIDIYFKKLKPTNSLLSFLTFVSFFPQLVAGPIERASRFLPQVEKPRHFSYENAVTGCRHILYGMIKKVVIADNVAELANIIFAVDSPYSGLMRFLGIVLFAIQIYCDFSGYSDIAIGTARLFNINLMTNFRRPYFARSLSEFWSRWHISLSTWFRDYVYIPLGGSRTTLGRTLANLFIVFLVSGLWHGANWTFVIWGAIHGFILILEKLGQRRSFRLRFGIDYLVTLAAVLLAWVFFRAESLSHALLYLESLFSGGAAFGAQLNQLIGSHTEISIGYFLLTMMITAAFMGFELILEKGWLEPLFLQNKGVRILAYVAGFYVILFFGAFRSGAEFIYFQF